MAFRFWGVISLVCGEKINLRPVLNLSLSILGMSKIISRRHKMSRLSLTYQRISLSPDFFLKKGILLTSLGLHYRGEDVYKWLLKIIKNHPLSFP